MKILLQLPGQQPSVAGVCGPIRLLQKDVTESAQVLSRRAHACETLKDFFTTHEARWSLKFSETAPTHTTKFPSMKIISNKHSNVVSDSTLHHGHSYGYGIF